MVYYVRVRYEGSKSGWSSWSTVSTFTPSITISGPTTISTSQSAVFTITNYDAAIIYTVTATLGTITQSGNTITYTAAAGTNVEEGSRRYDVRRARISYLILHTSYIFYNHLH